MAMAGFDAFLIVITAVICVLSVVAGLYILVAYQHPEDRNQAWLPKIIVVFGISLAIWTVLLFPLDVANRKACSPDVPVSYCKFAIPAQQLWYACYIAISALCFLIVPFAMFYYEADSESSLGQKVVGALMWTAATAITFALILGIAYTLVGYVEYPVLGLGSGLADLSLLRNDTALDHCLVPGSGPTSPVFSGRLCDAINGGASHFNWRSRVSLPVYIIAMSGTAGWVLFMVFSGVGLVALPVDLIREFIGRPRSTIPRSEYIRQATTLGRRAKDIKEAAELLKNEERQSGRGRRWKSAYRRLNQQLTSLESEQQKLELSFPQGEDPDYAWVVTVITFYVKLLFGVVGLALTATWIAHIITYVLVYPPLSPFLNQFFIKLDSAFPLFGTVAFALYCFYLIAATIKGCTKVGLTVLIFTVHPMKPGATLMNSFLFNVALVLLSTTAAIQFCAQSFALYASGTAIQDIWGNQVSHLMGIKYLYELHVFIYCLLSFVLLSAVLLGLRGKIKWKRYSKEDAYAS